MNILIVNQPLNNRGDESAHKALVRTMLSEMPTVSIRVLWVEANPDSIKQFAITDKRVEYVNIKEIRGFHRIATLSLRHSNFYFLNKLHPTFRHLLPHYKEADWVVCAPGGICMGGFQNWMHLFYLYLAKKMGKNIAYYGRSIGPFPTVTKSNRRFRQISVELLKSFKFLALRDRKSEEIAESMGLKYQSTVDTAFLDSPHVASLPEPLLRLMVNCGKYIVFVPNKLIWHYAYRNISEETIFSFFQNMLKMLLEKYPEHHVVLLPQIFNITDGKVADYGFFLELSQRQNDNRIIVVPDRYSSDIQQTIISNASFLIGVRYHSIVFALNNSVPFVALSYEHKMSGLLKTLGKENCMVDITNAFTSVKRQNNVLVEVLEKLTHVQQDEAARKNAKKIAMDCFQRFKKTFLDTNDQTPIS